MNNYMLGIAVENEPNMLARIVTLCGRKGFEIESINANKSKQRIFLNLATEKRENQVKNQFNNVAGVNYLWIK